MSRAIEYVALLCVAVAVALVVANETVEQVQASFTETAEALEKINGN